MISFLNTIFLAGLTAAAIPLLLHLFSRRRMPLIPFSTLEFLRQMQKRKTRRIQLKQIILLILRTLALTALVLAFARPAVRSSGLGGDAAVEVVALFDDGLNSAAESRDGSILRLAREKLSPVIDLLRPQDRLTVIPASRPDRALSVSKAQSDLLNDRLESAPPAAVAPQLEASWSRIDSLFAASPQFNREVFVISGFFSPQWDSLSCPPAGKSERRFLLPVGPDELPNLSVSEVKVESALLQAGAPVELSARIANHSTRAVKDALVGVYLEGARVAQAALDLPAEGSASASFSVTPDKPGLLAGCVKAEDGDALAPDDCGWFTLDVPEQIKILAVASEGETRIILQAALAKEVAGFFQVDWETPDRWEAKSFKRCDVVLLTGVNSVSAGTAERLAEFVRQGGGLIWFQNLGADLADLSRGLWKQLGFAGAGGVESGGAMSWGKVDLEHPLFRGVFDREGAPRSPQFKYVVDLAVGRDDQVIIPLSNGRPFLIERALDKGRALMYAVPLSLEAGDFIFTGIFAPLMVRSISYVSAGGTESNGHWRAVQPCRIVLRRDQATSLTLGRPNGDRLDLLPRVVTGGVEYDLGRLNEPGVYDLCDGERIVHRLAVNLPTDQSDLRRRGLDALGERLDAVVLDVPPEELRERVLKLRYGRELWAQMAGAFLVMLLAESAIARIWRKGDE